MKKINAVTRWFHPVIAGKELSILETYSRLASMGWDVTVHTSSSTPTETDSLPSFEIYRGIKIKRYPQNSLLFIPWTLLNVIEKESYLSLHDLELLPHLYLYLITAFLKLIRRKKYLLVYSSHGLLTLNTKAYNSLRIILKRIIDRYVGVPLINFTADGIRDLSKWNASRSVAMGIERYLIRVIPNGLDDKAFEYNDKGVSPAVHSLKENLKKYILQIGRIDKVKNYEISIRAMSNVNKDVSLVIMGPGQDKKYKKRLDVLVEELGLKRRIRFLGTITGKDKYYLLRNSQMYLCSSWSEAFSNTTLEAMSQGVPCVGTKGSALEELILDGVNGWTISADDDTELSEKINKILTLKTSKIIKIKQYNLKTTKNYTWDRTADLVNRFYLSLQTPRKQTMANGLKKVNNEFT